jgi:hypothetical protein
MEADVRQVLRILDYRDIVVRLENGQLIARSRDVSRSRLYIDPATGEWCRGPAEDGPLPSDMVQFIRRFRDLIISHLSETHEEPAA